jgi:hypothetical protein
MKTNEIETRVADARKLGLELARVQIRTVRAFARMNDVPLEDAFNEVQEALDSVEVGVLLDKDPEDLTWHDLLWLEEEDQSVEVWESIKEAAREEERGGLLSSKSVESFCAKPWERAVYYAIRQGIIDEWKPVGGLELELIDMLVSEILMHRFWMRELALRATSRALLERNDLEAHSKRRVASEMEARSTAEAAEMVERFHRMTMRTMRDLRAHRKHVSSVCIQNAGQVNIGEKQVNLGSASRD